MITFQFNNDLVGPNGNFTLMLGDIELNTKAEKIIRLELPLDKYPEIANSKMEGSKGDPIFAGKIIKQRKNYCFVMMPFTEAWSDRVWKKIRDIVENNSFKCERADNLYGHNVLEDIWKAINEAQLLIADVTNKNPNVFYEIGLAHSLGKRVILITQKVDDIPFDFRNYRHLVYEDNVDGFEILHNELPKFIT